MNLLVDCPKCGKKYITIMTKEEAKQAMSEGKKVTHRYFDKHEWATFKKEHGRDCVLTEDGCKSYWDEWWAYRDNSWFDDGWELYKD